jgi:mannose-6-phosphate isomerase-like protein (cupin superfamily)
VFVVRVGRTRVELSGGTFEVIACDTIVAPRVTPFALMAVGTERFDAICCLPVGGEGRMLRETCVVPL